MEEITIYPNQTKLYWTVGGALMDEGFEEIEQPVTGFNCVYSKNNKYYGYIEGEYFNGSVLEAKLLEVDDLDELKEYYLTKKLGELKNELIGNEFSLRELNGECISLTDESEDIFNYSKSDFIYEDGWGSFAWGRTVEERGIFNVIFSIINYGDDFDEIIVRVDDIEIVF